jgi:hypothetical protein
MKMMAARGQRSAEIGISMCMMIAIFGLAKVKCLIGLANLAYHSQFGLVHPRLKKSKIEKREAFPSSNSLPIQSIHAG